MKRTILTLAASVVIIMLSLVLILNGLNQKERVYNAKVRYFDGTMEMIPVKGFYIRDGFMYIETPFGDNMYIGANNVILLEEVEDAK